MVMVMFITVARFIEGCAGRKASLFGDASVNKEFHGPVDRRVPYRGSVLSHGIKQVLDTNMLSDLEEALENLVALPSDL
jgi:hypothetical protein